MTLMSTNTLTVYSPDADEYVTGTAYHETETYVSVETPTGRCVGGPKAILKPQPARCDLCEQPIESGERYTDDGGEIAHTACVSGWFRSQWGRESLS